jgi:hypothetical protein
MAFYILNEVSTKLGQDHFRDLASGNLEAWL